MADQHADTLDRVLELTVLLGADMTSGLQAVGLTGSRAHVVWLLHHEGPQQQSRLAAALGVTPRNVTGLVDGLVATGFVTRESHPTDRRAVLVSLTPQGTQVVRRLTRDHRTLARSLFADLEPAVFEGFRVGLDAVLERLHRALVGAS